MENEEIKIEETPAEEALVEEVVEETPVEEEVPVEEVVEETPVEEEVPVEEEFLTYRGQKVVSVGSREVNGKFYKHIRVGDGSTYDLTDKEFELEVK